jgi:AraC-like DNA-binding protein
MKDFVSAFYLFESDEAELDELERADIGQLRFTFGGTGKMHLSSGGICPIYPISLFGPRMTSSRIIATGPVKVFGLGLLPSGWVNITQRDASEVTNRIEEGVSVLGTQLQPLFGALSRCASIGEMRALTETFLVSRIDNPARSDLWFVRNVDAWLGSNLNPDIDALVDQTGLTLRRVEGLMKYYYGAPPKMIVRKYRALRTASAIAHGQGDWRDLASEYYYDHSHCIRDVKAFVGLTPSAITGHKNRLLTLTFGRSALAGEIAPLSAVS